MDATITPNRSLSRQGFAAASAGLAGVNCITAAMFWIAGAWPVPIFLGLDVWRSTIAFRVATARRPERTRSVSEEEVRVRYEAPHAARTVWTSPHRLHRRGP
jgi:uncharacterized membrane protein